MTIKWTLIRLGYSNHTYHGNLTPIDGVGPFDTEEEATAYKEAHAPYDNIFIVQIYDAEQFAEYQSERI